MQGQPVETLIAELRVVERELSGKLENTRAAIKAVQLVCTHNWRDQGYDPRGGGTQHDKCSWCGLDRRT
jgi:hypothetical protein